MVDQTLPPRPTFDPSAPVGTDPVFPEGWSRIICGTDRDGTEAVLAGWDSDGRFWAYTDTETIAQAIVDIVEQGSL